MPNSYKDFKLGFNNLTKNSLLESQRLAKKLDAWTEFSATNDKLAVSFSDNLTVKVPSLSPMLNGA